MEIDEAVLEELLAESVEREKEFVAQEKLIRRKLLIALGRVKVAEPVRELHSPTGRKSKWGELARKMAIRPDHT